MKALNKESILDCDELETELHDAEIKQLDEQLFLMPNYPCEFEAFVVPSCSGESFDTNDSIHLDSETLPQTFFWLTQSS